MDKNMPNIPEDGVDTIIATQQSYYEHIQSMSATFLSIIIGVVAAFGGLVSAGILTPSRPQIPSELMAINSTIPFTDFVIIHFPKELVKLLVSNVLVYSLFYIPVSMLLIITGISLFLSCLNVRPIHPEKYVRNRYELSIKQDVENSKGIKKKWINSNADLLDSTESNFNSAKYNVLLGSFLLGWVGVGVLSSIEVDILLLIMSLSPPIFIMVYIIASSIRAVKNIILLNRVAIVRENSRLYPESTRRNPLTRILCCKKPVNLFTSVQLNKER